jgi:hypothetical protein
MLFGLRVGMYETKPGDDGEPLFRLSDLGHTAVNLAEDGDAQARHYIDAYMTWNEEAAG